jgi:hypothetical protein
VATHSLVAFIERIPSGAQYVTLQKYFSHPSLIIYFFPITRTQIELALKRKEVGDHKHQTTSTEHNDWPIRNRDQQFDYIQYTLL